MTDHVGTTASAAPSPARLRLRDLAVLLLSVVAVLATFQGEGTVTLHTAFVLPLDADAAAAAARVRVGAAAGAPRSGLSAGYAANFANGHFPVTPSERLPAPKVADVDRDGVPDIVVATYEPGLRVYTYVADTSSNSDNGLLGHLVQKRAVSLQGDVRVKRLREAAALEVGVLRPDDATEAVVVLTKGLAVVCLDGAELTVRWEHAVHRNIPVGHAVMEASIVVVPAHVPRLAGLVVVGVRVAPETDAAHRRSRSSSSTTTTTTTTTGAAAATADEADEADDVAGDAPLAFGEGHFSYFALDGATGDLVWKHEEGDFLERASGPREQHEYLSEHFKADARVPLRHRGEEDWRQYRSAMLHWAMPHRWVSSDDTHIHLARFEKNRRLGGQGGPGRDTKKRHADANAAVNAVDATPATTGHKSARTDGTTPQGRNTRMQPLMRVSDERMKQNRVAQTLGFQSGLEVLQETLFPDSVARPVDSSAFNVLVAHLHDGVEVLQIQSGQPLCRVSLGGDAHGEASMWADVNGDGVLDHVAAYVGEIDDRVFRARGAVPRGSSCYALVRSGVPAVEPLFNGSLCDGAGVIEDLFSQTSLFIETQGQSFGKPRGVHDRSLEAVAPLAVPRIGSNGEVTFDSVFLVSDGKITSYDPNGKVNWHIDSPAWWYTYAERTSGLFRPAAELAVYALDTGISSAFRSSLTLMSAKTYAAVTARSIYIVALGFNALVLLDPAGNTLTSYPLLEDGAAIHNPVFADLNGDGYTDILIVRRNRLDGIIVEHHADNAVFSILIYVLLAVLVAVFIRQAILTRNTGSRAAAPRSRPLRGTD